MLFLLADCILFASFIFAYLYLRTSAPDWPPVVDGHQIQRLDVAFGAMNSIVLFGSGVTMHYALESWKHLKQAAFNFWIVATILLGIGFLLGQSHEYLSAPMTWHGQHVRSVVLHADRAARLPRLRRRLLICTVLAIQANRGVYTGSKYFGLIAGTLYWHFVDVIWVLLFFLFYLVVIMTAALLNASSRSSDRSSSAGPRCFNYATNCRCTGSMPR